MKNLQILHCDSQDYTKQILDDSIDLIIEDPPYTDGKVDVLAGHEIQTKINIEHVLKERFRILKSGGFFVFFGLFPTASVWYDITIKSGFTFRDKIIWAKRMITAPYLELQRSYEEIFIFEKRSLKAQKYYNTQDKCEDIKTPALSMGLYELGTLKVTITDLQKRLMDRKYDDLYYRKNDSNKPDDLDLYISEENKQGIVREDGITSNYSTNNKKNDIFSAKIYNNTNDRLYNRDSYGEHANGISHRFRSKWFNNLTNLWSFLPREEDEYYENLFNFLPENIKDEFINKIFDYIPNIDDSNKKELASLLWSYLPHNQQKFNNNEYNIKHPTVKPIQLIERIIKLCSKQGDIIFDGFMGSGTAAIAAINTNRNFIGCEINSKYFAIAQNRVNSLINKQELFV